MTVAGLPSLIALQGLQPHGKKGQWDSKVRLVAHTGRWLSWCQALPLPNPHLKFPSLRRSLFCMVKVKVSFAFLQTLLYFAEAGTGSEILTPWKGRGTEILKWNWCFQVKGIFQWAVCLLAYCTWHYHQHPTDTAQVYRMPAFHSAGDCRRQAEGSESLVLPTREATASGSDERKNGATPQGLCSSSFWLSALVLDSQVSLNFSKGDLFENPSGCQRNSPFPHHRSTPGRLPKKSKYHRLPQRGGRGSSKVVGLLRMRSGRKGQQKRASLLSNRDTNKDLLAARNSALKPCKTRKPSHGQKGHIAWWGTTAWSWIWAKGHFAVCKGNSMRDTELSLSFSYLEDGHKAMTHMLRGNVSMLPQDWQAEHTHL